MWIVLGPFGDTVLINLMKYKYDLSSYAGLKAKRLHFLAARLRLQARVLIQKSNAHTLLS